MATRHDRQESIMRVREQKSEDEHLEGIYWHFSLFVPS